MEFAFHKHKFTDKTNLMLKKKKQCNAFHYNFFLFQQNKNTMRDNQYIEII